MMGLPEPFEPVPASIFDLFAGHEAGRQPKAYRSGWTSMATVRTR
jgi:hypothetical protein